MGNMCSPRSLLDTLGAAALLLVPLAVPATPLAAQNANERPCRTDYRIRASYEEAGRLLRGEATIAWRNESRDEVPDLWFHLYWNAFANEQSSHLSESGRSRREPLFKDGEWGSSRITSLIVQGEELAGRIEWMSPDDQRAEDRSVFRVRLPKVARNGDLVVAQVQWEARIPRVRRRAGYKDDFLMMVQWFPKLGVYETGNGWNCHQFHAWTEFFSNYGHYDVELELPRGYAGKVGASGVQVGPTGSADGRVTVRFAAPSERDRQTSDRTGRLPLVHDFAWAADRDFVPYRSTFHYDEWAVRYSEEVSRVALALGRGREEMRLRDVAVTVLLQPEHVSQGRRHFEATCTALFFYGLWWGEYPYEQITVIDPPWGGGAAGGMEYPALFTAGTRLFTLPASLQPEGVVVHEAGHQFWYGLVGNNEFEAAWLDEGFNTFSQNDALWMRYGERARTTDFEGLPFDGQALLRGPGGSSLAEAFAGRRLRLPFGLALEPLRPSGLLEWWRDQPLLSYARVRQDPRDSERIGHLADPDADPIDRPGWLHLSSRSYRANSYQRTAAALRSLRGLVGDEPFLRGMRHYSERWRYAHPYPQDFFDAFVQGSGADVTWFLEGAFRSTHGVDWSVEVEQGRSAPPRGLFQDAEGAWAERAPDPGGEEAPEAEDGAPPRGWDVQVVVRRRGELLLPLTLELTWAGGRSERLTWSRAEQARTTWWRPLEGRGPSRQRLASAVLDPDRRWHLDRDLSDNQWHAEIDRAAPLRWSERMLSRWAHLLHWWGGIGG